MADKGTPDFFFNPRSIAVVGASLNPAKLSHIVMKSIEEAGFSGRIYPVNPAHTEILGKKCYPHLEDIDDEIDVAIFALPAEKVVHEFEQGAGNIRGAIVISGGFSETGKEGRLLEEALLRVAKNKGIRIIGPNCMGIYDTISGLDTLFIPYDRVDRPPKGRLAILSQSGSFALTAMDVLAREGIGVSRMVSYGNKIDVDEADCLDFLRDDDNTDAVIMYIEGIDDGRRFVESAKRCGKHLFAIKVGRREAGRRATSLHTGSIAGRYELYRAAFREAGITELSGFEEFLDACRVVHRLNPTSGNRVMIVTDGGGMGVSVADMCADVGLQLPQLPDDLRRELEDMLPPYFTISNPLDLTGNATDEWYLASLEKTMTHELYQAAIVLLLWGPPALTEALPAKLCELSDRIGKPFVICSPGGRFTEKMSAIFETLGMPVFSTPEAAVRAASIILKERKGR